MQSDRSGQYNFLQISALSNKILDRITMAYVDDILSNNWTVVKFRRYIVAGRPDYLYSSLIRLMVRFGSNKRRKKRMMNVDDAIRKVLDKAIGENLHITSQDDKLNLPGCKFFEYAFFLSEFILGGYRNNQILDPKKIGYRSKIGMITDYQREVGS